MPSAFPTDLTDTLQVAVDAARAAGALIRDEFHRPGGPRGQDDHADIDAVAETTVRDALQAHRPDWGFVGEETARHAIDPQRPTWVVDPNDGTSAFLQGHRGSAVSIALIVKGVAVLGVVFAPTAPDDDGDLFAWAEGLPLTRNGVAVDRPALPTTLTPEGLVLLNASSADRPLASAAFVAPARHRCVPSIAYRLALVAAGEADATVSTSGPVSWDVAGGHALMRAVGAVLVDDKGKPIDHRVWHGGNVYGGSLEVAQALAQRGRVKGPEAPVPTVAGLAQLAPVRGLTLSDPALLRRAQGCLLGQLAGDALGSRVEFESAASIARRFPAATGGVRDLVDGGTWNTLAGQPTDDSEMALTLARCLVRDDAHDPARIADAYRAWKDSGPFDIGTTTAAGLRKRPDVDSASNGSLMRVSPLALWAHARSDDTLAAMARAESDITHPNPRCRDACAAFCIALAHGLRGADGPAMHAAAVAWATRADAHPAVRAALHDAVTHPPADMFSQMGLVTKALQNAFYALLHAPSLEAALVDTVARGGDTDTTAAIAGALLGALWGREGVPVRWRRAVLGCVPVRGAAGVQRPRPSTYWPTDALVLAERLVVLGQGARDAQHPFPRPSDTP